MPLNVLDKKHTIAGAGFNRWLMPPAALAIHLCIGMAYGFSVFWLPLSKAIGIKESVTCAADVGFFAELFVTTCDWKISTLGWMYTLFFVFLGSSAAIWGGWLEHVGPRRAGVVSAFCWCGGMLLSALGIYTHQFWLMLLGSGVIGGIGLGLGYISPVSMLIKWFPDRRGMATGMAIMGFGGGAMIGSPLATLLMGHFANETNVGVMQTFIAMAGIYFVFMMSGAMTYRLPVSGWQPSGWMPAISTENKMVTPHHVHVKNIFKIKQFWLLWGALCMNISAGIGVIGMSSPMLQEVFGGQLIGLAKTYSELDKIELATIATVAAGFTALLSLFNIGGRFFWGSLSDKLGRKLTFMVFFVIGSALYLSVSGSAMAGNKMLFVGTLCLILSMYGGAFATVPAYLADLFGTQMVGAIHGRLLTAWATAGILGPVIVNYMRDYQLGLGIPREQVYNQTMWILAGLLIAGLICNLLIRPVDEKWFMNAKELKHEKHLAQDKIHDEEVSANETDDIATSTPLALVFVAWLVVGIPLGWGIYKTLMNVGKFFV
ncbi:MAG: OFA family MFS transporter [Methylococcales bacterium]|nr:OFA family MFS transporter [Methylococcales bacterium]